MNSNIPPSLLGKNLQVYTPEELSLRNLIGRKIGLSDNHLDLYWKIIDKDLAKGLYMISFIGYSDVEHLIQSQDVNPADRDIILGLRGVVLHVDEDQKSAVIIARGASYIPTCTIVDEFIPDQGSVYKLTDSNGKTHTIDFDNQKTLTTPSYDGCVMRISLYNGEIYVTTNKTIDTTHSRWGLSPKFHQLYESYGGPEFRSLFGPEKSSNITHMFILVAPDLQIASRYDIGLGYLTYLGYSINDPSNTSLDFELSPSTNWQVEFGKQQKLVSPSNYDVDGIPVFPRCVPTTEETIGSFVVIPTFLTLETTKIALTIGASNLELKDLKDLDPRLRPSEAVIVITTDDNGDPTTIRICSTSWNWRSAIADNNSNPYCQFVSIICCDAPHKFDKTWGKTFMRGSGY